MGPGLIGRKKATFIRMFLVRSADQLGFFDRRKRGLIVCYADDFNAKWQMMFSIPGEEAGSDVVTSRKNILRQHFFWGLG